jgi:hypothetical protein
MYLDLGIAALVVLLVVLSAVGPGRTGPPRDTAAAGLANVLDGAGRPR